MPWKDPEQARIYLKQYYAANRSKILKYQQNYYTINREKILSRVRDYEKINAEQVREKKHEYYLLHKEDAQIYSKLYYQENKQHIIERTKIYYSENRISILEKMKKYHASIPDMVYIWKQRYREINREVLRIKGRTYSKNHKIENVIRSARRRAWKKGAPLNDFTPIQWIEIQIAQKYCCYYCGKRRKGRLTQDHITPLSKGGSHTLHNVIAACRFCNQSKGNRKSPIPVQPFLLTIAPSRKPRS